MNKQIYDQVEIKKFKFILDFNYFNNNNQNKTFIK